MVRKVIGIMLSVLMGLSHAATSQPLPKDQAFALSYFQTPQHQLILQWQMPTGYYLYKNKLIINELSSSRVKVNKIEYPAGVIQHDDIHGNYEAYQDTVKVIVPLVNPAAKWLQLQVKYQGCSQQGFCYPPIEKNLKLDVQTLPQHENKSDFSSFIAGKNLFWVIISFLGMGLLLAFTPCVLPMIPILSSIIVGRRKHLTTLKAFTLSLAYVLGMAFTYALAGILIALMGRSVQTELQQPIVLIVASFIFVLMAMALLGFYELRMPVRWQRYLTKLSYRQKGGTFFGDFCMGSISSLVVSPCVTPPLVGVLAYIGNTGNMVLGAVALLALGLGMGIPLLLIGVSADKLLPKTGRWMQTVEKLFGVIMLGMAILIMTRVIPDHYSLPCFVVLNDNTQLEQEFTRARQEHKPIFLDFYADWCQSCVFLDHYVLSRRDVQKALTGFVLLRADVTANTEWNRKLLQHFQVIAPPTLLFFDAQGNEINGQRIIGETNAKNLLLHIKEIP